MIRLSSRWPILFLSHFFVMGILSTALRAQEAGVPQLPIESYKLANGLKVALSHDPNAPRTTVSVAYHVGSKNEREGLTGFAHFFEHMMFRGTSNVPSFDVPLQEAGASPNAFTSEDVTVYFETIPNNYLQRALYMEAERMAFLHTALDQEKFDTEREVVKNERRQSMENVPYGLAEETIQSYVFPPGHPYSWSVIGSMRDLDRASLDDLRQFFFEFYHPGNATLTLVGSFDVKQARQWIDDYFGPLEAGEDVEVVIPAPVVPLAQRITQLDQVQFPRVYWVWPTVTETHPDAAALDMLAAILSDGDASRLYRALVVDERLASDVDATSDTREFSGTFAIDATTAPQRTVEEIEEVLAKKLAELRATAPSESELQRAKNKHEVAALQGLTSPMMRAIAIGTGLAQYDDPQRYQKLFKEVSAVSTQDVQRVAEQYLTPDHFTLVIMPVAPGQEESPAVLAGPLPTGQPRKHYSARATPSGPQWNQLPLPFDAQDIKPPKIQRAKLDNGLDVWISPWHSLPLVSVRLIVPAGSADDGEKAGLANLMAQVWEQGTKELNSQQYTELMDSLGVSLGISTSADTTEMGFTAGTNQLDEVLQQLGPLLSAPRLDPTDIEREKELILSELAQGPDSPGWIAGRVFPRLLYGKHPYASPEEGLKETVTPLTRDDLQNFYRQHFVPQRSILIVVGDVDEATIVKKLNAAWESWQGDQQLGIRAVPKDPGSAETVYVVDKPGAVQSVLRVGRIWNDRRDPGYAAAVLGNRVLGGDFLSRINQNLREQHGFTYGAQSLFRFHRQGSDWLVATSVRADVTAEALRELIRELDDPVGDRPLTEEEVEVARQAELNEIPESYETPSSIAHVLASLAVYELPADYLSTYPGQLKSTPKDDISRVLSNLLEKEQRIVLVVGDRKQIEPQLKEAGFKTLKFLDTDGNAL
jgi:zinc protease